MNKFTQFINMRHEKWIYKIYSVTNGELVNSWSVTWASWSRTRCGIRSLMRCCASSPSWSRVTVERSRSVTFISNLVTSLSATAWEKIFRIGYHVYIFGGNSNKTRRVSLLKTRCEKFHPIYRLSSRQIFCCRLHSRGSVHCTKCADEKYRTTFFIYKKRQYGV